MYHDLERFSHGGVNITGFQLVDHELATVQSFLEEWSELPRSIWEGAGNTVRVRLHQIQTTLLYCVNELVTNHTIILWVNLSQTTLLYCVIELVFNHTMCD